MEQQLHYRKKRKQNIKIYSLYRMISMDIIFFYAIDFLFLTQVKNITASEYVLKYSFYSLFMILLQVPISIMIDKLGTRRCTILGNLFNSIYLLMILLAPDFKTLVIAEFVSALCFSLKDIADSTLLSQSIPDGDKKSEIFSRIEGERTKKLLFHQCCYFCSCRVFICNKSIYTNNWSFYNLCNSNYYITRVSRC